MISSLYPSVGTVVPYMIGNLDCLVLFTTYPTRHEYRCPLYRVLDTLDIDLISLLPTIIDCICERLKHVLTIRGLDNYNNICSELQQHLAHFQQI
jgi:hypothetical protein